MLDAVAIAGPPMHEQARTGVPLAWLEAVPPSVRDGRSDLVLTHAVLRSSVGDTLGADEIIRQLGPAAIVTAGRSSRGRCAAVVMGRIPPDA